MLHALWYLPTNFITFLGSRQRTLKKCRISAIYQPAEQNLLHVENIYKDTIDLRERSSRAQVPQAQPNYKIMKRMWNALFRRKIVFRFSLQQFETDDGCFFKRRNRRNQVSNLTAQKELLYNLNLGWSSKFLRKFPYSRVLQSYGSAGRGTCGTHIIDIYIYIYIYIYLCVCKRRASR